MTDDREPPEAVLFDCDGVLVDSERLAVAVEVGVLDDLGWQITPEEIVERFLGISDADYIAQIERHLGITLPDTWLAEMEPRYREAFEHELCPVPGVERAIDVIEAAGVLTAVASSGTHEKMEFTLGITGLSKRFSGRIFSAVEVAHGKPAPDLFLHAAASLGVDPRKCAVVEDSVPGVEAAQAAGMWPIAYSGGLVPAERLHRPGITVINDMAALPALILDPG